MTTYEHLLQEGRKEERKKTKQKLLNVAKNCFQEGLTPETASKISSLPLAEVLKIYKEEKEKK